MPMSQDPKTNELAKDVVGAMHDVFGKYDGYRTAHARGLLFEGTFTPTQTASTLSAAPHFNNTSTPMTVRFSSSTGIPQITDTNPSAAPRGFAIRFHLGDRKHTDIVAHSVPSFPVSNGEDFLAFFKAIAAGTVDKFLENHPATKRFNDYPKPVPVSFGVEKFYGVNAFKLVRDRKETFVRYRFIPEEESKYYTEEELKAKGDNFLFPDIIERVKAKPLIFKFMAQVAEDEDVKNDATRSWPDDRKVVELGTIKIEKMIDEKDQAEKQRMMIFDPVPRVHGIEPSNDPLIDFRAAVYLASGSERRPVRSLESH